MYFNEFTDEDDVHENNMYNKGNKPTAIHFICHITCNFPTAINELESNAGRSESRNRGDFS
jgi:hypothetical protein